MHIRIIYCAQWKGYVQRAASLAQRIQEAYALPVTLEPGGAGQYDIWLGDVLVSSTQESKRLPAHDALLKAIGHQLSAAKD